MSLINKMLQELDRRHAVATPAGQVPTRQVRAVSRARDDGRVWFWRVFAILLALSIGWAIWFAYQMQPRSLVNDQAFQAAERAERRALLTPEPVPAAPTSPPLLQAQGLVQGPEASVPAQAGAVAGQAAAPDAGARLSPPDSTKPAGAVPEALRLALSIETPIPDRPRQRPVRAAAKPQQAVPPATRAPELAPSPSPTPSRSEPSTDLSQGTPVAAPARVEKRDRVRTPADRAEADFRRGVALLIEGRASEADDAFKSALGNDASHRAARQALIARLLEQHRLDEARNLLEQGLTIDPAHTPYAVVLARIFVERGDLPASLAVLNAAKDGARGNADFNALLGTVLQRLAKHSEAADAYREALHVAPKAGPAWVGLAISLEALEHRPEAAEAFRRGIATGSLGPDLRAFAEQRANQLQR